MDKSGIQLACEKAGGPTQLADMVRRATGANCTQQAVSLWVKRGFAPIGRVPLIAKLTGVPREKLCGPKVVAAVRGD